jgi:hypothetical protein
MVWRQRGDDCVAHQRFVNGWHGTWPDWRNTDTSHGPGFNLEAVAHRSRRRYPVSDLCADDRLPRGLAAQSPFMAALTSSSRTDGIASPALCAASSAGTHTALVPPRGLAAARSFRSKKDPTGSLDVAVFKKPLGNYLILKRVYARRARVQDAPDRPSPWRPSRYRRRARNPQGADSPVADPGFCQPSRSDGGGHPMGIDRGCCLVGHVAAGCANTILIAREEFLRR